MLSGNGRHRRPRQAPALVVAAGVTGSAIAIPLLGASGAHAADGANWDRVAECETGGAWSQNSGNGYYGGLQLSQEDWERYGGLDYASSADQASRAQQIRVAEQVLADQGIAAWPTCGLLAGLGNDSASTGTGAGTTDDGASESPEAPESSESSVSSGLSGSTKSDESTESPDSTPETSPSSSPTTSSDTSSDSSDETAESDTSSGSGAPTTGGTANPGSSPATPPKSDDSDKSGRNEGSSGLTATEEPGTGRHRGDSADEGAADGRTAESSGRHASRGEGEVRGATDGSYTVREGDSLWGIADSLELSGGWRSLYADNKETVGADPDHILPGQKLDVVGESGEK
ncbi:LysM peptidoglycan-binding domain-containing protein [Streptomyces sp. TRM S81-3]|uniref:LysM peptidoglycan-binding domain-containing protein n=1 Tax=Streptomyces griseicoloratus TaxID=2752516 RepID=A0A926L575_9ACTN|nr:transglycosylase family protein [Streptomyces griseicoloratus]MBD0420621.1 LysM peptidoglycan-binding domain-containing protein [Streptomyces griseicoloratus]